MNKDFVIYNAAGEILRTGNAPEEHLNEQAGEGEFVLQATACCTKDSVNVLEGTIIPNGRPAVEPTPPRTQALTQQGLPVDKQLDLLWQAMDAGTYPKAEPFYSAIKATKHKAH